MALNGFLGKEVRIEVKDGFWVDRFYIVQNRLYFVSAFVGKALTETKQITDEQNALIKKYFASFKLQIQSH